MRQRLFCEWQRQRHYFLPDEEALALKDRLQHSLARSSVAALVAAQRAESRDEGSGELRQRRRLADLPPAARALVLDFLPIVPTAYVDDATRILAILRASDASQLYTPAYLQGTGDRSRQNPELMVCAAVATATLIATGRISDAEASAVSAASGGATSDVRAEDIFDTVERELRGTHSKLFGTFALFAVSLGFARDGAARTMRIAQREAYGGVLRAAFAELRAQRQRYTNIARWTAFRDEMLDTPCAALREAIREDLLAWEEVLGAWHREHADVTAELALGELRRYLARVPAVEYIGDPALTLDDVRNMFWEVNLRVPSAADDRINEEYPRSITMRQAMTLGIADIPWVAGFTWNERRVAGPSELGGGTQLNDAATCASVVAASADAAGSSRYAPSPPQQQSGAAAVNASVTFANRSGTATHAAPSYVSHARSDRVLQFTGAAEEAARRQAEEMEAERVRLEAQSAEQLARAHTAAADGMTQRLWIAGELFVPRVKHRFGGCELCARLPVHHVGLERENSGATGDIVLCAACYDEHYGVETSVAHRLYTWFRISDLIDGSVVARLHNKLSGERGDDGTDATSARSASQLSATVAAM